MFTGLHGALTGANVPGFTTGTHVWVITFESISKTSTTTSNLKSPYVEAGLAVEGTNPNGYLHHVGYAWMGTTDAKATHSLVQMNQQGPAAESFACFHVNDELRFELDMDARPRTCALFRNGARQPQVFRNLPSKVSRFCKPTGVFLTPVVFVLRCSRRRQRSTMKQELLFGSQCCTECQNGVRG